MTLTSNRGIVLGLFLTTLVFHLVVAWQDFAVLARNGFLYDDSFYAFKIAANIAHGHGMTFDGVTPTNGFQPLYVFLLVPFFWMAGANLIAPVYAALSLAALFTAFAAVLLFKLLRRYVSDRTAALAAVLWAFSPVVIRQTANGLETSLALLLFAGSVYFYVSRIRSVTRPGRKAFLTMGALLGVAVLARIDQGFVAVAILLDYLIVLRSRRAPARSLRNVAAAVAAAAAVYTPWLVISLVSAGGVFQDSGAATRFLSIAYAPLFNLGSTELLESGPTAGFLWGHFVHALSVLKVSPPVHIVFRALEKIGEALGVGGALQLAANIAGLILVAVLLYHVLRPRRGTVTSAVGEVRFLLIVVVALVAAYSFYVFGVFFFMRYLYPIYFIACIYVALLVESLIVRLGRQARFVRSVVIIGLVLYAGGFAYMAYSSAFRSTQVYYFYDVAQWLSEHTDADEKIGVFQGGAVGYLSDRDVVNLDGKVNRHALDALRKHSLAAYLEKEGVDVVLDNSNVLDLFLFDPEYGDPRRYLALEKIMHGAKDGVPGWAAYRIHRPGVGSGTTPATPLGSSRD